MSDTVNVLTPQIDNWNVKWGPSGSAFDFGLVDAVDPSKLELVLKEIKRGTVGDTALGDFAVGLKGELEVMVPDLNVASLVAACPWMTAVGHQLQAGWDDPADLEGQFQDLPEPR